MGNAGGRTGAWLRQYNSLTRPPLSVRRALTVVGGVGLVIAAIAAIDSLPADLGPLRPGWVAILVVLAGPAGLVVNVMELRYLARVLGADLDLQESVRISVMALVANVLPVPGAALTRLTALRAKGVDAETATRALIAVGLAWLCVSGAVAGAVVVADRADLGVLLLAGSLSAGGLSMVLLRPLAGPAGLRDLVAVELTVVLVASLRFWVAFEALGLEIGFIDSLALAASGAIASAIGFMPGGLGLKELLATVLGGVLGLGSAETLLAATLDRAVALATLIVFAVALLVGAWRRKRATSALEGFEAAEDR